MKIDFLSLRQEVYFSTKAGMLQHCLNDFLLLGAGDEFILFCFRKINKVYIPATYADL